MTAAGGQAEGFPTIDRVGSSAADVAAAGAVFIAAMRRAQTLPPLEPCCCRSRRLFLRKSDSGPGSTSHPLVARCVRDWRDRLTGEGLTAPPRIARQDVANRIRWLFHRKTATQSTEIAVRGGAVDRSLRLGADSFAARSARRSAIMLTSPGQTRLGCSPRASARGNWLGGRACHGWRPLALAACGRPARSSGPAATVCNDARVQQMHSSQASGTTAETTGGTSQRKGWRRGGGAAGTLRCNSLRCRELRISACLARGCRFCRFFSRVPGCAPPGVAVPTPGRHLPAMFSRAAQGTRHPTDTSPR